jgi:hypothetical protein
MSSTAPGDKIILDQVLLKRQSNGQIQLYLSAAGRVIYQELFSGWLTALQLAPRLALDWTYGVILGRHHGDGDR